jgi:hypothetical protein
MSASRTDQITRLEDVDIQAEVERVVAERSRGEAMEV